MSTEYSHFTRLAFDKLFAVGLEGQEVLLVNSLGIWVGPGGFGTAVIPVTQGGTGATSANGGLNALLPSQTGNAGKFLTTDGSNSSWGTAGGGGSTTSISVNVLNVVSSANFAGRVKLANGSVSAPSLTFTNYLTTGLFLASAALPAFAVGGVEMLRINALGAINLGYDSGTDYNNSVSTQDLNFRGQTLRVATAAGSAVIVAALNRKTSDSAADASLKAEVTSSGGAAYTFLSRNATGYSLLHDTDNDFKIFSGAAGSGGTVRARYEASSGKWFFGTPTTNVTHNIIGNLSITGTLAVTGTAIASNLSGTNTGDQTITLTGNVTGSGTGSFATTIASSVITNVMVSPTAAISGSKIVAATTAAIGVVTISAQSFAGVKTFVAAPKFTSLSASLPLKLDGSNNVLAQAIALGGSEVSGSLPTGKGGTGATSANGGLNALLPTQTGNAGKFLQTDGSNTSWASGGTAAGGVTTVGTIDSQTPSANGAVISGASIYFQNASSSAVGLMSIGAQSIGGVKTYRNQAIFKGVGSTTTAWSQAETLTVNPSVTPTSSTYSCLNVGPTLSSASGLSGGGNHYAFTNYIFRVTTANVTDISGVIGARFSTILSPAAATAYTNNYTNGISTMWVDMPNKQGAGTVNTTVIQGIYSINYTTTIATRSIFLYTPAINGGTNNAFWADNRSFTGDWFINYAGTRASTFGGNLTTAASNSGDQSVTIQNTATSTAANAVAKITVGGTAAGDPYTRYRVTSGSDWSEGIDNSDSDTFKICQASSLGTNTYFSVTTGAIVGLAGPVDFTQIATPATPAASHDRLYFKSGGIPYKLNSSGTETPIAVGTRSVGITIDGAGSAITTGVKGYVEVPYTGTITGWTILGDQSGSIVVDVWKDTYANYPPTVADTIAGSEKPTISSATKGQDLALSTWTTSVTAGDIIGFNVDSCTSITRATLVIRILAT